MAWTKTENLVTKHTCGGPVFGRKTPGCPRCDEPGRRGAGRAGMAAEALRMRRAGAARLHGAGLPAVRDGRSRLQGQQLRAGLHGVPVVRRELAALAGAGLAMAVTWLTLRVLPGYGSAMLGAFAVGTWLKSAMCRRMRDDR